MFCENREKNKQTVTHLFAQLSGKPAIAISISKYLKSKQEKPCMTPQPGFSRFSHNQKCEVSLLH
jgi:hypothetical protein